MKTTVVNGRFPLKAKFFKTIEYFNKLLGSNGMEGVKEVKTGSKC